MGIPHKSNLKQEAKEDEYFRAIVDSSFNWEYLVEANGHLKYISPACEIISGYSPEDFQQSLDLLQAIVHPEDRITVGDHLQERIDPVSEVSLQFRIITKEGDTRWILHRCRPFFDRSNQYLGRRATNQDITLRKNIEFERMQAEKRLKQLTQRLITIQEAERKRISQDLHDDIGQSMTVRDNLKLIDKSPDIEALAKTVEDNGGVYFVPAFSGLFAPYWKNDARGVIAGLTRYVNRGHIARAALEATAFQTREVLDAMNADSGVPLKALKVDGGMVYNDLLMQFQADVLGVPVVRPKVAETTALGAAYAAGLAVGFWQNTDEMRANWGMDKTWEPSTDDAPRTTMYKMWKKAVTRTFDWVEH